MQDDAGIGLLANPYPGIRAFRRDEAAIFFGRDDQIDGLVARLESSRLVAVAGESGCGKSSLVRAGLLPTLEAGFLEGAGARWCVAEMRPENQPIANLAAALTKALDGVGVALDASVVAARLRRGPLSIIELIREPLPPNTELLILVDQFEELIRFRARSDPDEADAFVAMLLATARSTVSVRIVLTLRTDYLGHCALFSGLPEALNGSQYLVPRLEREQLLEAIISPARVFDRDVDPVLASHIVNEIGRNQDQLPVIEHALFWMWIRAGTLRDSPDGPLMLTMKDYDELGGLGKALSKHADEIYDGLDGSEQRRIAQSLFCALWDDHADGKDLRRPCTVAEAAAIAGVSEAQIRAVADVFRDAKHSLLMPPPEVPLASHTILDISHESLFRHWERLHDWIRVEAKNGEQFRHWVAAAISWKLTNGELLSGRNLEVAEAWLDSVDASEAWARRYSKSNDDWESLQEFLAESRAARTRALAAEQEAESQRRKTRAARIATTFAAVGFVLGLVSFLVYNWLHVWEHVEYCKDLAEIHGVPQCVDPIARGQAGHRQFSYRVVKSGRRGPIKRVNYVDGKGNVASLPKAYSDPTHGSEFMAREEYEYGPDGRVAATKQYAIDGSFVMGRLAVQDKPNEFSYFFTGASGMPVAVKGNSERSAFFWMEVLDWDDDGNDVASYRGRDGEPTPGRDWAFGAKRVRDKRGNLVALISINAQGKPTNDAFGNSGMFLSLNERGEPIEAVAKDADGKITTLINGWAIAKNAYDEYGNVVGQALFDKNRAPVSGNDGWHQFERSYLAAGTTYEDRYLDVHGTPTTSMDGCYRERIELETGLPKRLTCLDSGGAPMIAKDGFAVQTRTYDARGRLVAKSYFDEKGHPTIAADDCASVQTTFDDRDRVIEVRHLGTHGELIFTRDRWATQTTTYDDPHRRRVVVFRGIDHEPVLSSSNFAISEEVLDSFGHAVEQHYFDPQHNPVTFKDGYYGNTMIYDGRGNLVESFFLGEQGQLIFGKDGYAGYRTEHDELGRMTRATYLGVRHEKAPSYVGVAGWNSRFDVWGNEIERRYVDTAGNAVIGFSGDAGWNARYDVRGNQIEISYVGVDGRPALHAWDDDRFDGSGYVMQRKVYDTHNNVERIELLGSDREPAVSPAGWSRMDQAYDTRGNTVRIAYFAGDKPVIDSKSGAHALIIAYDAQHRRTALRHFGLDGTTEQLRETLSYDQFGEVLEQAYFGPGDKRTSNAEGMHRRRAVRNNAGLVVSEELFGRDGARYSWTVAEYDPARRLLSRQHLDPDTQNRKPIGITSDPCATVRIVYPSELEEEHRCLDGKGDLTPAREGWAVMRRWYLRPGQVERESYFDAAMKPFPINGSVTVQVLHDPEGREIEQTSIGPDGAPRTIPGAGWAKKRTTYDLRTGLVASITYLNAASIPLFSVATTYDVGRRKTEEQYFGPNGQPVPMQLGAQYITLFRYDPVGRPAELRYLTHDRKPMKGIISPGVKQRCWRWVFASNAATPAQGTCENLPADEMPKPR